jgi:hypothetical protein
LRDDLGVKAQPLAERAEQRRITARTAAEAMVEADDDLPRSEALDQGLRHEGLRLHGGERRRERHHDRGRDAGARDQSESLVQRGDRQGRPTGLQHVGRMRIERARDRRSADRLRTRDGRLEDRPMAEMDAVEDAERDHARTRVRREGLECPDDPHARS